MSFYQDDFAIYIFYFQLQELPEHNYETLKFLMNHLKTVSDNCDKNKVSFPFVMDSFWKRPAFRTTGVPAKWGLRTERRGSVLKTCR